MNSETDDNKQEPHAKVATVSATILGQFFDALEKDETLSEVTSKLRKAVLDDGVFAEPAIRAALFPDAT